MVKDFSLNLDSFQRFHRILPEIKSQTAKAAATWGFQVCYFFLLWKQRRQGREDWLSLQLFQEALPLEQESLAASIMNSKIRGEDLLVI